MLGWMRGRMFSAPAFSVWSAIFRTTSSSAILYRRAHPETAPVLSSGVLGRYCRSDLGLYNPRPTTRPRNTAVQAPPYAPICLRIARAWAAGSEASVMGRPTTMWLAPAAMAWAGVTTRTWSATLLPAGRTPGVTRAKE